jgi:hypothetical protein
MDGENGGKHLSLKQQCRLIKALVRAKNKGGWDQEAANELGAYMEANELRRVALSGYYAQLCDGGLYVERIGLHGLGPAWLHVEYSKDTVRPASCDG